MAGAVLLGILPQLTAADSDIRYAVRSDNRDLAERALERLRTSLPVIRAYLKRRDDLDMALEVSINRCGGLAREAEAALVSGISVGEAVHALLEHAPLLVSAVADRRSTLELEGGGT